MEETKVPEATGSQVNEAPTDGAVATPTDEAVATPPADEAKADEPTNAGEKTLTQEEFNKVLTQRIGETKASAVKGILDKFGFATEEDLEGAIGKAQAYDVMKERYAPLEMENTELKSQLAMQSARIDPTRVEDVKTFFKGLGKTIDDETLATETAKHPEWVAKQPNLNIPVGSTPSHSPTLSDEEEAEKAFGYKFH